MKFKMTTNNQGSCRVYKRGGEEEIAFKQLQSEQLILHLTLLES